MPRRLATPAQCRAEAVKSEGRRRCCRCRFAATEPTPPQASSCRAEPSPPGGLQHGASHPRPTSLPRRRDLTAHAPGLQATVPTSSSCQDERRRMESAVRRSWLSSPSPAGQELPGAKLKPPWSHASLPCMLAGQSRVSSPSPCAEPGHHRMQRRAARSMPVVCISSLEESHATTCEDRASHHTFATKKTTVSTNTRPSLSFQPVSTSSYKL
jgi:hypothetical protein